MSTADDNGGLDNLKHRLDALEQENARLSQLVNAYIGRPPAGGKSAGVPLPAVHRGRSAAPHSRRWLLSMVSLVVTTLGLERIVGGQTAQSFAQAVDPLTPERVTPTATPAPIKNIPPPKFGRRYPPNSVFASVDAKGDGTMDPTTSQSFSGGYYAVSAWGQVADAIYATSDQFNAIYATSDKAMGVFANSISGNGVVGLAGKFVPNSIPVKGNAGVYGRSYGRSSDAGVKGESDTSVGVHGISHSANLPGVFGVNDKGGPAGSFQGRVDVTGDVALTGNMSVTGDIALPNADCAEEFAVANGETAEPGTVMVIDAQGKLRPSYRAYDKGVAGVISGAGFFKPGIILDRHGDEDGRLPLALVGKVYCKVDARTAPIARGDLLTSSTTPGYAMRATDPSKAFGSVIGKALGCLDSGTGLIPILVALQ